MTQTQYPPSAWIAGATNRQGIVYSGGSVHCHSIAIAVLLLLYRDTHIT